MARTQAAIEQEIVAEIGERMAKGLKANACSRVCGILVRNGEDWNRAFDHIADHFKETAEKPKNTLFHKRYHDKETLRLLLLRAASGPSHVRLTKLMVHGDTHGKPAVEIVRFFGEPIGESSDLTCLRIFIDFQGNLITAYPGAPR